MSKSSISNYYIAFWDEDLRKIYNSSMFLCVDNSYIVTTKSKQKTVIKINKKLACFIVGLYNVDLPETGCPTETICDII